LRYLYLFFLFGAALVLQSTVLPVALPYWIIAGIDLPLLVVIHMALIRGKVPGMLTGALLGYLQDAMTGGILGINALAKTIAGFTGGYLREIFFVRSIAHRASSVAGAIFFSILTRIAVLALFDQPRPGLLSLYLLWAFLGNTLLTLGLHSVLSRFEVVTGIRQEEELSLGD
jgi:rod shape-determining protein MreD